jgi:hypothetical protein
MKILYIYLAVYFISCAPFNKNRISSTNQYSYIQYYEMIYNANVLFSENKILEAKNIYEKAFSLFEPINLSEYYEIEKLAIIYDITNDLNNCESIIYKLFSKGYPIEFFQESDDFKNIKKSTKWNSIKKKYPEYRKNYLRGIDLVMRSKISFMVNEDQKVRQKNLNIKENFQAMKSTDSISEMFLYHLLESDKFPNQDIIGNYWIDKHPISADILFMHTSDSMRLNYFIPKMMEFVKKGKCSPKLLSELVDQYNIYNGKRPIFASYFGENFMILKPQNPEFIDLLRTSIGIPSLKLKLKIDSSNNIKSRLWQD